MLIIACFLLIAIKPERKVKKGGFYAILAVRYRVNCKKTEYHLKKGIISVKFAIY